MVINILKKPVTMCITGGTGTFGNSCVDYILNNLKTYNIKKIIIFSRDEYKQVLMKKKINIKFNNIDKNLIQYVIGDVKDKDKVDSVISKCNYVIHAAALKHVPICEENPQEAYKTNIQGTNNIINSCIRHSIDSAIFLSTDKAVEPINLYGATKMVAEKTWIQSNQESNTKFSVVRYGNIVGSRGSIIDLFMNQDKDSDKFTITDKRMTRFWLDIKDAVKMTLFGLFNCVGGEVFIPPLKGASILDIPMIINPNKKIVETGIRPGEKLHEQLLSRSEINRVHLYNNYYIVTPEDTNIFHKTIQLYEKYKIQPKNELMSNQVENIKLNELQSMIEQKSYQ